MRIVQKLISFILVFCMLASVAPAASAVEAEYDLASVSAQGETALVYLLAEKGCTLYAAQYDAEDGRMLGVSTVEVSSGNTYQTVAVPLQETERDFDLKVFLTDSVTGIPLCGSYSMKSVKTAAERYSVVGLDAEEDGIVATVSTDEACTMEVQVWDQRESELLFTTMAEAEAGLNLEYISAAYTGTLPEYFILRAVLKDEDGNALSNPYVNRRNTEAFLQFASQTEADYRDRSDVTFLEVGEANDGNFLVLNENVTYLNCSASVNTFTGESNGVLTFKNADADLTGLAAGDLFAFMNTDGQYETVKIKEISVNNGVVSVTRDEEVYLADFYDVVKINADLTYEGDEEEISEPAMLRATRAAEPETQLLKVEFGPAVKTNMNLGIASVEGALRAGGKVSMNYNPELLGEKYMDITVIAGFKGEVDVTLGAAKGWKNTLTLCSIPLVGVKEALGASLDAELVCQIDSDFGYNFTLEAETCYGFTYSTDTGGQVLKQEHFTQKDADSDSKLKGHAEIEVGIRGGLNLSLLNKLVNVSAGAEGGLVLSGDLEILSGTLPVNAHSYHACDLCINGDCKSYFEIDITLDYKINKWLTGTILDLDLFRIEATLGSFYLSLFSEADSVHEGAVAFGWADSCPNKKYRVEIHTYDSVSNSEVVGCTVAVINENHNSDTLTSPGKLYLYPGTYTAKATIGLNQAEKTFTVQNAAMTVQLNGANKVLSGKVSDRYTGRTIADATVQVNQGNEPLFTTTTNVIGEYSIELPDGDYRVIFMADGYESQVYPLTIQADKVLNVTLESEPYTITFDANGGSGSMSDMEFHRGQTITLPACTFTPPEGKVFGGWLIDNDVICDAGTSYDPREENHTLTATWKDEKITHTVTVTVLTEDGTAVSGQAIAGTGLATAPVTGSDGTVTFKLEPGTYTLSATDANNKRATVQIELTEDTTVTLTLKTIEWSFNAATGTLTVIGNGGPMPDYQYYGPWWNQYSGKIKSVVLSDVTTIGKNAFYGCESLTSIAIPDSVTVIGAGAFYLCKNLTDVALPDHVTTIGAGAFRLCKKLTGITIPDSVATIDANAFAGTGLTSITIPDSVTTIRYGAFCDCTNLTSIAIPEHITMIPSYLFDGCSSLTGFKIHDGVEIIGSYAFKGTGLTGITIPDSVDTISEGAFYNCSYLTSLTIPDSVFVIGQYAFSGSGLTSITIPDGLTTISYRAFNSCRNLTSITIPGSLKSIGSYVFDGCTALTDIYYVGSDEDWAKISISGSGNDALESATIHCNYTSE